MNKTIEEVFEQLREESKNKIIELGKPYYVSEWSWLPICDGYITDIQIIRYKTINEDGEEVYYTGNNYRAYHKYEIWEKEEEAREITKIKNSFGYKACDYDAKLPINVKIQ